MKTFFKLYKISLGSALAAKNNKSLRKILLFAGLFVYLAGFFGFMLYEMGKGISVASGNLSLLIMMGLLASNIFILLLVISSGTNILFKSKDNWLLLSMPINKNTIIFSKFLATLTYVYAYELVFLIPSLVIYYIFNTFTVLSLLYAFIGAFFVPIFIFAIAMFLSTIFNIVTAKLKNKNLFTTIFLCVFTLGFLILYYSIDFASIAADPTIAGKILSLENIFIHFKWFINAVCYGNGLNLLWLVLSSSLVLILCFLFIKKFYFKVCSICQSNVAFTGKNKVYKQNSPIKAFVKKEFKRLISSPIVLFNTCFGLVLTVIGVIYLLFDKSVVLSLIIVLGFSNLESAILLGLVISLLICTCNTACLSISLEQKNFEFLKILPMTVNKMLLSKVLTNIIICLPFISFAAILIPIILMLPFWSALVIFVITVCFNCFYSTLGVFINLKLPRIDALNDTVIAKQTASSFLGVFLPMIMFGLLYLIYSTLLANLIGIALYSAICLLIIIGLNILLFFILKKNGKKYFNKI